MKLNWLRFLQIQHNYTDLYELQRARGLWRMAWGVILLSPLYFLVYQSVALGIYVAAAVLVIVGMIATLVLINRGQLVASSLLYIVVVFLAVLVCYLDPANRSSLLVGFTIPVVAAGVLLNRRGMVVMIGLVILALTMTTWLVSLGALPPFVYRNNAPLLAVSFLVITILLDGIMLIVIAGGQRVLQKRSASLTQELRSSSTIIQTIAGIKSIDELLKLTVELISDQLNYQHVQIFLLEEKTNLLVLQAGTALNSGQKGMSQHRIAPSDTEVANEALRSGQTVHISSEDSPSRRKELLNAMQAEVLIPLRREDRPLGVLDVQSINPDAFGDKEVEVLRAVAAQLAISIENARLFSQLQTINVERQQLADQVRNTSIALEQLSQEVTVSTWARYLENQGDGVIGYDWKDGTTKASTDITTGLARALKSIAPELYVEGAEQVLSVPIMSRGQTLGVMEFRAPADRVWNNRSIELARVIGQRLALALDNLRLFEQAQVVANREKTASEVAANLQTKTDMDTLVSSAAEAFQQALGATRTSVRLGKPEPHVGQNGKG